jgi:hypothetical protein
MRRIARIDHLVPAAFVLIVVLVALTRHDPPCSATAPCGPGAVRWVAYGSLAAPPLMVYVHRWAAAVAACCCAVLWLAAFSGWVVLLAWAYAGLLCWVARRRTEPADPPVARRKPVAPPSLPFVARPALVLAVAAFAVAAGLGGWVRWRQDGAERQQARARIVTGVVRAQLTGDEPALRVALAGGGTVRVGSRTPADYPVGSAVRLTVDDRGLRQLRSEPYDITPWLALAVAAAGFGAALLARVARQRRELRLFFATPQPVRAARVVDDFGYVHVLVPAADHRTAVEFGIDVAEAGPLPDELPDDGDVPVTVPATLYGEPRAGRWCAVEVGGRLRVPTAPVGDTAEIPYDAEHAVPQEVTDDDEQVVDPGRLTAYDRDASPDEVHEHRISPVRAWLDTVLIGLGAAGTLAEGLHLTGHATGWPLVATVAAGSAAGLEFGWRARIRPRLRWDVGGVASVGFRRRDRQPWTVDSAALADGSGGVTLIAGDAVLTVEAPPPWPPWAAQRTADQLVAALRYAQHRAVDSPHAPPPPEISLTGRPPLLYAAWAATVAVAALVAW